MFNQLGSIRTTGHGTGSPCNSIKSVFVTSHNQALRNKVLTTITIQLYDHTQIKFGTHQNYSYHPSIGKTMMFEPRLVSSLILHEAVYVTKATCIPLLI